MIAKVLLLIWMLITIPFGFVFSFFRRFQHARYPLTEIIDKTAFFLSPQLNSMKQLEGNKYSHVTYESIFYIIAVGEAIGGRTILKMESMTFLKAILGDDYETCLTSLLSRLRETELDPSNFRAFIRETNQIAKDDVRGGMLNCSNYLLRIAQNQSQFGKTLAADHG